MRAANVTVTSARRGSPHASPVSPSTPRGNVDGQDGHPGGHGRGPVGAPEPRAVGGVDRRGRRSPTGPMRSGASCGVDDLTPGRRAAGAGPRPPARRPRCCPCRPPPRRGGRRRRPSMRSAQVATAVPARVDQGLLGDLLAAPRRRRRASRRHAARASRAAPHAHGPVTQRHGGAFGDHGGDGDGVGVGQRHVPAPDPRGRRSAPRPGPTGPGRAAPLSARTTSTSRKPAAPDPHAERLEHRLLGGEADGQAGPGVTARLGVGPLASR